VSENGVIKIREIRHDDYYPAVSSQSSSATSPLRITMDELFSNNMTAIEDNIICVGDKTLAVSLTI